MPKKRSLLAAILLAFPCAALAALGDVSPFAGLTRDYGDGGPALPAALNEPYAVAAAPDGALFIADTQNRKIRRIDPAGVVTTLLSGIVRYRLLYADGFVYGDWGRISTPAGVYQGTSFTLANAASDGSNLYRVTGNMLQRMTDPVAGTGATIATLPEAQAWRHLGWHDGVLYAFGPDATYAYDIAADSVTLRAAIPWSEFVYPRGYATDGVYLYVSESFPFPSAPADPADNVHRIWKVSLADGSVAPFLGSDQGDADGTGLDAAFSFPQGLAVRGSEIFIADMFNHKIRKASLPGGVVTTVAGAGMGLAGVHRSLATFNTPLNASGDEEGNLYVAGVGGQHVLRISSSGLVSVLAGSAYAGDRDGAASVARFRYPSHVAVDGAFLYVADFGTHKIRRIHKASGEVTTLAGTGIAGHRDGAFGEAQFAFPWGLHAQDGRIYIADTGNHAIREIDFALGRVRTLAGSPGQAGHADGVGAAARFRSPRGLSVHGDHVYIADSDNHVIRRLDLRTNAVTTLAGNPGTAGFADNPDPNAVRFLSPWGVSFGEDYVYVADTANNRVRRITKATGETVSYAGSGAVGSGDGPGASATFNFPHGLYARQREGKLYVADTFNHLLRTVEIPVRVPPAAPAPPSDLAAEALAGLRIRLTWSPSPSSGVVRHAVYMARSGETFDFFTATATLGADASSWTAAGLEDGVTYRFVVRAATDDLEEDNAAGVSATAFDALTCPSASIKNPHNGKKVGGNSLTIMAETEGAPVDVLFQYRPLVAASTAFLDVVAANANHPNPDLAAPWFVHWDPSSLPNGEYMLRALARCPGTGYPAEAAAVTIWIEHQDPDERERKDGDKQVKESKVASTKTNKVEIAHPGSDMRGRLELPGSSLNAAEDAVTIEMELPSGGGIAAALRPGGLSLDPNQLAILDVTLGSGQTLLAAPALISFDYSAAGLAASGFRADQLTVTYFDPVKGAWEAVPNAVDPVNRRVSAWVTHFSKYGLGALTPAASADLSGVRVYPVPYVPDDGNADNGRPFSAADADSGIVFKNLTADATVTVFDVTGRQVWASGPPGASGVVQWDARTGGGREIGSGVYFALIEGGGSKIVRKLAVVR